MDNVHRDMMIIFGGIFLFLAVLISIVVWQSGRVNKILLREIYDIEMTTWQAGCVSITLNGETE